MQIFLPYSSPLETAKILDPRRLNKQILECSWILNADEKSRVRNHPIYKMYYGNLDFVILYQQVLQAVKDGDFNYATELNLKCYDVYPEFLRDADWYFDNFKRRLYTKDSEFYKIFESYGTSDNNYYFVDGGWVKY